jgi:hypothetical protein
MLESWARVLTRNKYVLEFDPPRQVSSRGGSGESVAVIELEFKVHPKESKRLQIAHKYLTTTPDCTMAHLSK